MPFLTLQGASITLRLVTEPSTTTPWVYPTPPLVLLRSGTISAAIETQLPVMRHFTVMCLETTTLLTAFTLLRPAERLQPTPTQRSVPAPWRTTTGAMTTLPWVTGQVPISPRVVTTFILAT